MHQSARKIHTFSSTYWTLISARLMIILFIFLYFIKIIPNNANYTDPIDVNRNLNLPWLASDCLTVAIRIHLFIHSFTFFSGGDDAIRQYSLSPTEGRPGRVGMSSIAMKGHPSETRLGDRSFAVAGPPLWNDLPVELR